MDNKDLEIEISVLKIKLEYLKLKIAQRKIDKLIYQMEYVLESIKIINGIVNG